MPYIKYIEKDFRGPSLVTIKHARDIINEYQADGLVLTLRQLYYQFVSRGLLANKQSEYKRLGSVISDARLAGLIDWDSIEDRTRNLNANQRWEDPGHIIHAAANSFKMDHWTNQKYRIEVWIEKEALLGVIAGICEKLDVDYFACKGYVSLSEMWGAARRLGSYFDDQDQDPIIIHLGDHDPSGIDMTRDITDRLETFELFDCIVHRIALNMNQIEEFQPPPNPAKLTDTRAGDYIKKFGKDSWELDALDPKILKDLIEDIVLEYRDDDLYQEVKEQEAEYLKILKNFENNWENETS